MLAVENLKTNTIYHNSRTRSEQIVAGKLNHEYHSEWFICKFYHYGRFLPWPQMTTKVFLLVQQHQGGITVMQNHHTPT